MPAKINLLNQKIGKLLVIEETNKRKNKSIVWKCQCDCGNIEEFSTKELRSDGIIQCHQCGNSRKPQTGLTENIIGKKFNHLTVLSKSDKNESGKIKYKCECDCENKTIVFVNRTDLQNGHTTSCGCYAIDNTRERATKHGLSNERLYDIWRAMRYRCRNETDSRYFRYGGRGIKVCDEWNDFETFYNWAMQNGYEPDLSIDRIDNDGDYCPENCRWVNDITQANNKCTNRNVEYNGVTHTVSEWARLFGVHKETLRYRINHADMRDFEAYFGIDI